MAQKTFALSVTSHRAKVTDAVTEAIVRAFEICGGKAETYAKRICPVDTGRLRNSITHKQEGTDTEVIGTNVEYAPYVEFGHHTSSGKLVSGKPYLAPALENHISEYREVFEKELEKI